MWYWKGRALEWVTHPWELLGPRLLVSRNTVNFVPTHGTLDLSLVVLIINTAGELTRMLVQLYEEQ